MNPKDLIEADRLELERILYLNPITLSEAETNFLYGRREYLNAEQRETFADVIKSKDKEVEQSAKGEAGDSEEAEKPTKKDKDEA